MSFWEYLLLFGVVVAGGASGIYLVNRDRSGLKLVLSFGGAYLLAITSLHLLPEAFHGDNSHIGFWILAGFFLQLLLEFFSKGVEHGHIHPSRKGKFSFGLQIMIGLSVHAFIEGLPLSSYEDFHSQLHQGGFLHGKSFLLGIIFHKIPAAVALAMVLAASNYRLSQIWLCILIFASMSPLGSIVGAFFQLDMESLQKLLGLVIGTFLHISTTILFETDEDAHHKVSWKKLVALGIGLALAIVMA